MARLAVLSMALLAAAAPLGAQETTDLSARVTPSCEIAGVIAVPPPSWINVPFEKPPEGNLGCVMIRTNEDDEPVGILRIRSRTAPALSAEGGPFEALFINEVEAVQAMGFVIVSEKPLFLKKDVPIKGEGFRDGVATGLAAKIEGNAVPQEVHILVFRSDEAEYLVTLLTPAKSHDAGMWERNTEDFGTLIRTLRRR